MSDLNVWHCGGVDPYVKWPCREIVEDPRCIDLPPKQLPVYFEGHEFWDVPKCTANPSPRPLDSSLAFQHGHQRFVTPGRAWIVRVYAVYCDLRQSSMCWIAGRLLSNKWRRHRGKYMVIWTGGKIRLGNLYELYQQLCISIYNACI